MSLKIYQNKIAASELNLRGVSADLEFDATAALIDDGSLAMEAHFDMDRTRLPCPPIGITNLRTSKGF